MKYKAEDVSAWKGKIGDVVCLHWKMEKLKTAEIISIKLSVHC